MKYILSCSVERSHGSQIFEVIAKSEKEAIEKHNRGESEMIESEVEVTKLGKPEVIGVEK